MTIGPYPSCLKALRIRRQWLREAAAELLGTCILILVGEASGATAKFIQEGGNQADHLGPPFVWGLAVFAGIMVSMKVSGGHINPAVTVALATLNKFPWKKVPHYLLSQYLGAFLGASLLYVLYYDTLSHFYGPERAVIGANKTAEIWATYPQEFVTLQTSVFDQLLGTGLLLIVVLAITDPDNLKVPHFLVPLYAGFTVTALVYSMSYNCMAALNPARDLAPRLFTAIAGWGTEPFSYRHFWWVGVVCTHVGAILGSWIYFLLLENNRTQVGDVPSRPEKDHSSSEVKISTVGALP